MKKAPGTIQKLDSTWSLSSFRLVRYDSLAVNGTGTYGM